MYGTKKQEMSGMHANRTKIDQKNKEKTKANCFDFILGSIKNEIRKKSRLFQMLLSRLWVNLT